MTTFEGHDGSGNGRYDAAALGGVRPYVPLPDDAGGVGPGGTPLLPGGYGRSTFEVGARSPRAVRGEGWRLWDDQGREVIDLNNNFASLIHGHAQPDVVAAAEAAVRDGASFGLPNLAELEHARALVGRLPSADQVRYANSGTEAVMTALRIARAHTGRDRCVFVQRAYHGTSDPALVSGGPRSVRGVPAGVLEDIVTLPINDEAALERAIVAAPDRFAAVVLDFLPNRAGLLPLTAAFVETAVDLCRAHGILLLVDEVISLRLRHGGLAADRGVVPDLTILGKLIGGGHPVGAVAGRAEIMAELDPTSPHGLEHGGTFSANPVTMQAGRVTLELLDEAAIGRLNALGDGARAHLEPLAREHGWIVRGTGSMLRPFPADRPEAAGPLQRELWWEAYHRGVLLVQNGLATLSTPMDEEVVATAVERVADAMAVVSRRHALAPVGG